MTEQLYGVLLSFNQMYNGRDRNGAIKTTIHGGGTFMTKDCAESLARILKSRYPQVKVVELFRDDRDDMAARNLSDLGEELPLERLTQLVQRFLAQGTSREKLKQFVEQEIQPLLRAA